MQKLNLPKEELQLPKPVSGRRLVEILNTAAGNSGFGRLENCGTDENGFSDYSTGYDPHPQAFDNPELEARFLHIKPDVQYPIVQYEIFWSSFHEGKREPTKDDKKMVYDTLIAKIIEYSNE